MVVAICGNTSSTSSYCTCTTGTIDKLEVIGKSCEIHKEKVKI